MKVPLEDQLRESEARYAALLREARDEGRPLLVLVTGSRDWSSLDPIRHQLDQFPRGSIILHGCARGADGLASAAAEELGLDVRPRPAEWARYGKAAGIVRNRAMLEEKPELVLAFHPCIAEARGTRNMVEIALAAGVPVRLVALEELP